jgi:preprotein translocase subunit SecA
VEGQNFSIRKHLLEYDDVMNKQRESIYRLRREILQGKNMKDFIQDLTVTLVEWIMENHTNKDESPDDWEAEGFRKGIASQFGLDIEELNIDWSGVNYEELRNLVLDSMKNNYQEKEKIISEERMREFERVIMLQILDSQWKDHLLGMDYLKEGIGLRGYAQKDPLVEYKKESYDMFQAMMDRIEEETIRYLFLLQPVVEEELPERKEQPMYFQRAQDTQAPRAKQARSVIPKKRKKKKKKR